MFTAVVAGTVAWHSWRFVADEWEFGSIAFSGVPAWAFEVVIPVAVTLISVRYLLRTGSQLRRLGLGESALDPGPEGPS